MLDADSYRAALDALAWQIDLGADEAIQDTPLNRFEVAAQRSVAQAAAETPAPSVADPAADAREAADAAADLDGLRAALSAWQGFEIRQGARNLVFSDGDPAASVMVIGEAPDRDEDRAGHPFAGLVGQLYERMFAAIGLPRGTGVYATCALPWRPPHDRAPTADELAMMRPFLERHISLANPKLLVVMGNAPAELLLGRPAVSRLRGTWKEVLGRPALPMLHPAALLRAPEAKREAWTDLLSLKARL